MHMKTIVLTRYELIEDWIKRLETGDLSALRVVYSAFSEKDSELMKRAGEAIR